MVWWVVSRGVAFALAVGALDAFLGGVEFALYALGVGWGFACVWGFGFWHVGVWV